MYENLVFEGSGSKAIAFTGALTVLEERGYYKNIRRFAGTSSGSFVATLLAVGYTPSELQAEMYSIDFCDFVDDHWLPTKIYNLLNYFGFYSINNFKEYIRCLLVKKVNNSLITFGELYNNGRGKELIIIGGNLSKGDSCTFSPFDTPNMPIVDAMMISMSLPGIFMPIKYNDELYVDGGIFNIYPIKAFDVGTSINTKTLGLKIVNKDDYKPKIKHVKNLTDFITVLVDSVFMKIEKLHIEPGYWERTIAIESHISALEDDLSTYDKDILINSGEKSAQKFLRNNSKSKFSIESL